MRKLLIATLFSLAVGMGSAYAADIVVKTAPPKAVVEHRAPAPSRNHVWLKGYQRWDGSAYTWEPGRWEVPPRANAKWVAPRWTHRKDGWAFTEGRWK
jgi:hypothetical protein